VLLLSIPAALNGIVQGTNMTLEDAVELARAIGE
jgi:hypothetical protein